MASRRASLETKPPLHQTKYFADGIYTLAQQLIKLKVCNLRLQVSVVFRFAVLISLLFFTDGIGTETSTDDNLFDSPIKNTPAKVANVSSWSTLAQSAATPSTTPINIQPSHMDSAFQQFKKQAKEKADRQRQLTEQMEQRRVQKEAAERERQRQDAERRRERQGEELLERLCRLKQEQEAAEEAARKQAEAAAAAKAEAAAKAAAAAAKAAHPPASASPKSAPPPPPPAVSTPSAAAGDRERARMREQERRRREAVSRGQQGPSGAPLSIVLRWLHSDMIMTKLNANEYEA
ncbi:hypothetical protein FJT64_000263 [Amphibalanus amphitrite]|uniref:Uncharacterized protein n=1 Tax=Amphibalanus amphitrite TaxID=1232801 RepID=A0A6A4WGA2_AMPAM|nr:hypothetical protein FJT64_000263 [Amphibalanus amphitrite]